MGIICRTRKLAPDYRLPGKAQPAALQSQQQVDERRRDIIPGFVASDVQRTVQSYPPPEVPTGYVPQHKAPPAAAGESIAC